VAKAVVVSGAAGATHHGRCEAHGQRQRKAVVCLHGGWRPRQRKSSPLPPCMLLDRLAPCAGCDGGCGDACESRASGPGRHSPSERSVVRSASLMTPSRGAGNTTAAAPRHVACPHRVDAPHPHGAASHTVRYPWRQGSDPAMHRGRRAVRTARLVPARACSPTLHPPRIAARGSTWTCLPRCWEPPTSGRVEG